MCKFRGVYVWTTCSYDSCEMFCTNTTQFVIAKQVSLTKKNNRDGALILDICTHRPVLWFETKLTLSLIRQQG